MSDRWLVLNLETERRPVVVPTVHRTVGIIEREHSGEDETKDEQEEDRHPGHVEHDHEHHDERAI